MLVFNGILAVAPVIWLGLWVMMTFGFLLELINARDTHWMLTGVIIAALILLSIFFVLPSLRFRRAFRTQKAELKRELAGLREPHDKDYYDKIEEIRALRAFPIGGLIIGGL